MYKLLHILLIAVLMLNPLTYPLFEQIIPGVYAQDDSGDDGSNGDPSQDNGTSISSDNNSVTSESTSSDNGGGENDQSAESDSQEVSAGSEGGEDGPSDANDQVTQDQLNESRDLVASAWEAYNNALETGVDVETKLDSYLAEAAYFDSINATFSEQNRNEVEHAAQQQQMQDTISGTGINDIQSGASIEQVVSQHLDPSLSADRAAAVMSDWAKAWSEAHPEAEISSVDFAYTQEFQNAWTAYVDLAVSAGTVAADQRTSALAGGMSLAIQGAGGNIEQMANGAGVHGGIAGYSMTLGSIQNQLEDSRKTELINDFGLDRGHTIEDIAAARHIAGIGEGGLDQTKAATIAAYAAAQERGEIPTSFSLEELANKFDAGWAAAANQLATSIGVPGASPGIDSNSVGPRTEPLTDSSEDKTQAATAAISAIETPSGIDPEESRPYTLAETRLEALGTFAQQNGMTNKEVVDYIQENKNGLFSGITNQTDKIEESINRGYYANTNGVAPAGTTNTFGNQINDGYRGLSNPAFEAPAPPQATAPAPEPESPSSTTARTSDMIATGQKDIPSESGDGKVSSISFNDRSLNQPYANVSVTQGTTDANRTEGNTRIDLFNLNLDASGGREAFATLNFDNPMSITTPDQLLNAIDSYNKEHGTGFSIPAIQGR